MKPETKPKHGDLRVWWIPQVPMKAFTRYVDNIVEAGLLLVCLAEYDKFQFENNIKPDYCNVGGLQVFDAEDENDGPNGSWCEWTDSEGNEIGLFTLQELRDRINT